MRDDFEEPDEDEITYRKNIWGVSVKYNNNKGTRYKFIDCLVENIDGAKKVEILDGALTKIMPELHEDNNEHNMMGDYKYMLKRKSEKIVKKDIVSKQFQIN